MRTPYITSPPFPIPGDSTSALARFKYNPELGWPKMVTNARQAAFGDSWTSPLSKGFAAVAEATSAISKEMLRRKNATAAKNAFAALSAETDDFLHTNDSAIFKRLGANAVDAVKDTRIFYEKAVQKHSKGLHPDAQRQFGEMAQASRFSAQTAVGKHAAAEFMKTENAADAAAITALQNTALLAFTDDRVFGDNRQRMLDQVTASAGRLGYEGEQADLWTKQMDSELQRKRAEAFVKSGNLERADEILQSGELGPPDVETLTNKLTAARQQQAFTLLASLPQEQRLETANSPEKLAELGITLDEPQMRQVQGKLRVLQEQERRMEKKARENSERDLMARVVRMALGLGENRGKPDPVGAHQLLLEADPAIFGEGVLDEAFAALGQGRIGQDDPAFVLEAQKLLAGGTDISNAELARAVACGKLSPKTLKKLEKLRETADGPRGTLIEYAFKKLDEAFGVRSAKVGEPGGPGVTGGLGESAGVGEPDGSGGVGLSAGSVRQDEAESTPELIAAWLKARNEVMHAILEAKDDEAAREMLDLRSSKDLVTGILQRHLPQAATSPDEEEDRYPEDADAATMRALYNGLASFIRTTGSDIVAGNTAQAATLSNDTLLGDTLEAAAQAAQQQAPAQEWQQRYADRVREDLREAMANPPIATNAGGGAAPAAQPAAQPAADALPPWNLDRAIRHLQKNSPESTGFARECAKYVGNAIEAGGIRINRGLNNSARKESAYGYGPILEDAGFIALPEGTDPKTAQPGDVVVIQPPLGVGDACRHV